MILIPTQRIYHFLILFIFSLLIGCQHTPKKAIDVAPQLNQKLHHQDAAPPGPPPKKFQKVSPKNEPLSPYGNPTTYNVHGENYRVMTSAAGYHQKGIASWYGTKFHKARTSSGEPYNMYALTAAHKTLPLPSYVRVKNLENGREAIVKVNDRGPFCKNRVIDLSYGAAAKLGLLPKGTAQVELHALGSSKPAKYYLQLGAFQSSEKANALRNKLSQLNFHSNIQIEKRAGHYVIHLGPFKTYQQSEQVKRKLIAHGLRGVFSYLR